MPGFFTAVIKYETMAISPIKRVKIEEKFENSISTNLVMNSLRRKPMIHIIQKRYPKNNNVVLKIILNFTMGTN